MADRWAKLNTNWMDSEWLVVLSAESRLAWVQLICYTKSHGVGGRVKAKSPMIFAKQNFIGEEAVEQMIRAAKAHGAMKEENGDWILTGWKKHHGDETAAERMARLREKQRLEAEQLAQTGDDVTHVTRNARNVTAEEKRLEENRLDIPSYSPSKWKDGLDWIASRINEAVQFHSADAKQFHRYWENAAREDGLQAWREVPVEDRGDGAVGRIDLRVQAPDWAAVFEFDHLSARAKSKHKLGVHENRTGEPGWVVCRNGEIAPGVITPPFVKPTDVQLADYAVEIGLPKLEAKAFRDYQDSKGWMVGQVSMKDWKAALCTWKRNWEAKNPQQAKSVAKKAPPGPPPEDYPGDSRGAA